MLLPNHTRPSGPAVMSVTIHADGSTYWVSDPPVVIWNTSLLPPGPKAVNHSDPPSAVMYCGWIPAPTEYSVTAPFGVTDPTLPSVSVNHTFPSGPCVMSVGPLNVEIGKNVNDPPGVIRPI